MAEVIATPPLITLNPMNLVLLGPPGAGKGTLASTIAPLTGTHHISTGDLFRAAVRARSQLGQRVASLLQAGSLVPDSLTIELVRERLSSDEFQQGFILDGFPRTVVQAEALSEITTINMAVEIIVPEDKLVRRLSGRRICSTCGATFSITSIPENAARFCAPELRDDDTPQAIRRRLAAYHVQTAPVVEYYRASGLLKPIDGTGQPSEVAVRLHNTVSA